MTRSRDSRASRWRRALPSLGLGALVGLGMGIIIAAFTGAIFLVPLTVLGCAGVLYVINAVAVEGAGDLFSRLYMGGHGVVRSSYSQPASLAARGHYAAAIEAYEAAIGENPDDPEPLRQLARLLEERRRWEDAVDAYKRLRRVERVPDGLERMATRSIVDIYLHELERPRAAIPELARLAELAAGTSQGEWAARELAALRTRAVADIKAPSTEHRESD